MKSCGVCWLVEDLTCRTTEQASPVAVLILWETCLVLTGHVEAVDHDGLRTHLTNVVPQLVSVDVPMILFKPSTKPSNGTFESKSVFLRSRYRRTCASSAEKLALTTNKTATAHLNVLLLHKTCLTFVCGVVCQMHGGGLHIFCSCSLIWCGTPTQDRH